jgi:hypothetical protein
MSLLAPVRASHSHPTPSRQPPTVCLERRGSGPRLGLRRPASPRMGTSPNVARMDSARSRGPGLGLRAPAGPRGGTPPPGRSRSAAVERGRATGYAAARKRGGRRFESGRGLCKKRRMSGLFRSGELDSRRTCDGYGALDGAFRKERPAFAGLSFLVSRSAVYGPGGGGKQNVDA